MKSFRYKIQVRKKIYLILIIGPGLLSQWLRYSKVLQSYQSLLLCRKTTDVQ